VRDWADAVASSDRHARSGRGSFGENIGGVGWKGGGRSAG
jgi:hypothetical protein